MEYGFTFLGFIERMGEAKKVNEEEWGTSNRIKL